MVYQYCELSHENHDDRPWKEFRLSDELQCKVGSLKHPWRTAEKWGWVKTLGTPVVHIKIAGIYGGSSPQKM